MEKKIFTKRDKSLEAADLVFLVQNDSDPKNRVNRISSEKISKL